jgi:hypothetical protein
MLQPGQSLSAYVQLRSLRLYSPRYFVRATWENGAARGGLLLWLRDI